MNPLHAVINAARRLEAMFPGYFPESKHNHYKDFGYPKDISFEMLHGMFMRNGLARAGVEKTVLKTWQDSPAIWETEKPRESTLEGDIRQRFEDLRIWQRLAEADRRALVGGYSGAILRFADSKRFQEPVDFVPGGLLGLVEIIPAWAGQLTVAEWNTDETSENYGQPTMFQFNEAQIATDRNALNQKARSFMLHPDRVIIWSDDGTVHGRSLLTAGYNDLMTMEKVSGSGGEGFWKTARGSMALEADKDLDLLKMSQAMGVEPSEIADAMNSQVEDFQKGFDKMLLLQGMQAKPVGVSLPSPEHFFNIALQGFASSINIPLKILVGNQTGERASTEDARDWAQACMARRNASVRPGIKALIQRLEGARILPEKDWFLHWTDLTESSMAEKIDRAAKMAEINSKMPDDPVYSVGEIRMVTDHDGDGPEVMADEGDDE